MQSTYLSLSAFFMVMVLGGCSQTTGVAPEAATATAANVSTPPDGAKPPRVINKGMEADEIVRRIGKPTEIRPLETPQGHAEIWVYRRDAGTDSTLTATRVVQMPVINPLTGVQYTRPEPIYSQERRDLVEITNLLMFEGKLTEWNRRVEAKRSFN